MENLKCSLCGSETEFEAGNITPQWVLCAKCEGTEAAEAAGYVHN